MNSTRIPVEGNLVHDEPEATVELAATASAAATRRAAATVSGAMSVTGVVVHLLIMLPLFGRVAFVSGTNVRGVTGQSITLPCRYSVGEYAKSEMCWGRGPCPSRGCGHVLIGTDGDRVTSVTSQRYKLGGRIAAGNVSLTINDLQRKDSGWYCCRVEIPGPFNDPKTNLNLRVLDGRVAFVSGTNVRGVTGQSITLPCRYSVRKYVKSEMCWGRGQCGVMNCGDELIRTNGDRVTSVTSQRYSLGGRIAAGDVSLTINDLQRKDSGWYCCRVEIPGPFNDLKTNLNLRVLDETSTASPSITAVSPFTDNGKNITPFTYQASSAGMPEGILSSTATTNKVNITHDKLENKKIQLYLGIGLLLLISVTAIIAFIFLKKLKNSREKCNSNNAIGLNMHQTAEENIYQVSE
ncbi:hepatitis A virus cellular receptor 2 homolog [Mobula birostris]|uniref:hepatitis A virus cellular receptor 2 homolog n=1 Tax=Mobula birostris TaxID=1983395 RepID=UPI003B286966